MQHRFYILINNLNIFHHKFKIIMIFKQLFNNNYIMQDQKQLLIQIFNLFNLVIKIVSSFNLISKMQSIKILIY